MVLCDLFDSCTGGSGPCWWQTVQIHISQVLGILLQASAIQNYPLSLLIDHQFPDYIPSLKIVNAVASRHEFGIWGSHLAGTPAGVRVKGMVEGEVRLYEWEGRMKDYGSDWICDVTQWWALGGEMVWVGDIARACYSLVIVFSAWRSLHVEKM